MRLWHQNLIPYLSNQRLLGQHRECCALRGKGWNRKQSTVNYVFDHSIQYLYTYHILVILELRVRGFKVDPRWDHLTYRGKNLPVDESLLYPDAKVTDYLLYRIRYKYKPIYPEHDEKYLKECLDLLEERGEHINF